LQFPGFPPLLENPGIFIGKFPGPGKSWNLLDSDVLSSFNFKILIIVSIRYVFWAADMPKMLSRPGFLPRPCWQSL